MKKLVVVCALAMLLAVPAPAAAKKLRHSGEIAGDSETKVTLRVTTKKGKPKKVSAFKAERVVTHCDSGLFRFTFQALNPTKVNKEGNFRERLDNPDGSVFRISGQVRNKGKKTVGNVKSNDFKAKTTAGKETCRVKKQRFSTKKT